MNFNLMMGAIGYISMGTILLNRAQHAGYPFWLTAGGAALWGLAAISATWGFVGARRERRKWKSLRATWPR